MTSRSHAVNVYSADDSKKFRILPNNDATVLSGDSNPISIDTSLTLPTHTNVGTSLAAVETGLADAQDDIAANAQTAATATNTVAVDLNTYKSANDAALLVEKQRVDDILSGASVDLDTLAKIVSAYELADTTITDIVGSHTSGLASLTTAFNALLERVDALTDSD